MMRCYLLSGDYSDILKEIARGLHEGEIYCVPTDTVYGLICSPYHDKAIERLYELKKRPKEKPFALFVTTLDRMLQEDVEPSECAYQLADWFWPGALTIVMKAGAQCRWGHDGTIGVRSPDYDFLQALLEECGGLLINTSLNLSGEPPATSLKGQETILEQIDGVVDAGQLPEMIPSTVVDCTQTPFQVLREGKITKDHIYECISVTK